jgi:hypothetical protein
MGRAVEDVKINKGKRLVQRILYRPFDERRIWYSGKSKGFVGTPAAELMHHILPGENLAFITTRQTKEHFGVLATTVLAGHKSCAAYDINSVFPLYLYPNGKFPDDDLFVREELEEKRRPNFSAAFIKDFCERLKVKFVPDGFGKPSKRIVGPELIFNYAYAVFHSPTYRERYAEFLRTDFPRLPLTRNYELFQELAGFGGHLVDLHARNQANGSGVSFPKKGSNVIEEVRYQPPQTHGKDRHSGRVWINKRQYFDGVSPHVWEFPHRRLPSSRALAKRSKRPHPVLRGQRDLPAHHRRAERNGSLDDRDRQTHRQAWRLAEGFWMMEVRWFSISPRRMFT